MHARCGLHGPAPGPSLTHPSHTTQAGDVLAVVGEGGALGCGPVTAVGSVWKAGLFNPYTEVGAWWGHGYGAGGGGHG